MAPLSKFGAQIEVVGATLAEDHLKRVGMRAALTLPLMEGMKEYLEEISKERLNAKPYLPLTEGTIARKASQGEDTSIFRDESRPIKGAATRVPDELYVSLTGGGPSTVKRATRTTAVFGTTLFYAPFVQNVKGRKRKILAISASEAVVITKRVLAYIIGGGGYR